MLKRIIVLNILESIFKQYVDFIFNISSETIRNSIVVVLQGILGRKSQWHRVFSFRIRSFTGNAERQGSISAFHTKSKLLQHHSSDRSFSPKHQGMQSHEVMTLNRTRSPAEKKDDYSFSRYRILQVYVLCFYERFCLDFFISELTFIKDSFVFCQLQQQKRMQIKNNNCFNRFPNRDILYVCYLIKYFQSYLYERSATWRSIDLYFKERTLSNIFWLFSMFEVRIQFHMSRMLQVYRKTWATFEKKILTV